MAGKTKTQAASVGICWTPRLARESDIVALERLIPLSARRLQLSHYSLDQIEAALGPIFGVDKQLIVDGTYFVVEQGQEILGCGGWSRRRSLYGSDEERAGPEPELDPTLDAARVRAFFVHPDWARQGIGRRILEACEDAIRRAGFCRGELVATLPGVKLYAALGWEEIERYAIPLAGGLELPVVRMGKQFSS